MDPKNSQSPSHTKDNEIINPNNTTPEDYNVKHTETNIISSPSRQPSKKFQNKEFVLPTLNFDSDTSDDFPYSTHTTIEHSSKFDENSEEKIKCCDNLHERYHNLYSCSLEENSNPLENNLENKDIKPQAKKQTKLDRLDEILAEKICINEESPENYCELQEDVNVPPPAHGGSPWKQNQLGNEKEQKFVVEAYTGGLEQYEDDLEEGNMSNLEEEEDDESYLQEQEALLNLYQEELRKKLDAKRNSYTFNERPPSRRGERPPGRRGERPCDIISERPSSAGKKESNSCHNRYRMLNTPMRIGSAITSQSCNDSNSQYQLLRKNSDSPCSIYYEKEAETSEYYSTSNTVQGFFETRLDITNNIHSKYCSKKPTSISTMTDDLPMHYSLEEIQYLEQHEPETRDDIAYPSTSSGSCNAIVKETFPDKLPDEKKYDDFLNLKNK